MNYFINLTFNLMKKLLTISLLALLALSASAKSWDFTKWSPATLSALVDGNDWTDDEKGDGSSNVTGNRCVWNVNASQWDEEGYVTANGMTIPELAGLKFVTLGAKGLAIGIDYEVTTDANKWGPYHGPAYLWVNKVANCKFEITGVEPGSTIKMGVESHKPSDARGVDLSIDGVGLEIISGQASCRATVYEEFEWQVPEDMEPGTNITVSPNNGCHIYFIKCGDDEIESNETEVLYVDNSLVNAADPVLEAINAAEGYKATVTATPTAEQLNEAKVVVVSPYYNAELAGADVLIDNIAFQPVVNYSASLAAALGLEVEEAESEVAKITTEDGTLFADIVAEEDVDEEGNAFRYFTFTNGDAMPQAVKLTGKYANDAVYAEEFGGAEGHVFIHAHNANHNGYFYMPYGEAAINDISDEAKPLLINIINKAAATKTKVSATKTPAFTYAYGDMQTTVSIKSATANAEIHYTIDGTEPTLESALYTEPVLFTEPATIKAIAIADGYTLSEVAEGAVILKHKAQAPVIAYESTEKTDAKITLSTDQENVDIYYNFTGSDEISKSSIYVDSIGVTIKMSAEITAFCVGNDSVEANRLVQSDVNTAMILANTQNVRRDIVAHFDANEADWKSAGGTYYFSWGKSAQSMYDNTQDPTIVVDPETGEETEVFPIRVPETYKPTAAEDMNGDGEINDDDLTNDQAWELVSYGQVMTWETGTAGTTVGDNGSRNPERAEDVDTEGLLTKNFVSTGARASGEAYNARIRTLRKYQGPFNVFGFFGSNSTSGEKIVIRVSTDKENWTNISDTISLPTPQRLYKKLEFSYEGTDDVYVEFAHAATGSKAMVWDMYIMNCGEKSQEMMDGIEVVESSALINDDAIYNLAGQKVSADYRGILIRNGRKYVK